jgi:RNA polymerase sigma factor (sigma-70 family)
MEGLREGKPEAWLQFWERFYKPALAILSRRYPKLNKGGLIPDVVSDAFLLVIEQLRKGAQIDPAAFRSYVTRVALRTAATYTSRKRKTLAQADLAREEDYDADCPRPTPDIAYLLSHKARLIKKGLDQLMPTDRDIIVRFYLQEQPKEEIMAAYGMSHDVFRWRKTQALLRLTTKVYGFPTLLGENGRPLATFKELREKGCTWAH